MVSIKVTVSGPGDTELLKSEDQIRLLKLDAAELDRGIIAARKQQPIVPQLDVNIALLKKQLLDAQRQAAELSAALETPDNKSRCTAWLTCRRMHCRCTMAVLCCAPLNFIQDPM